MKREGHDFPSEPWDPWTSIFKCSTYDIWKGYISPLTEVSPEKGIQSTQAHSPTWLEGLVDR